MPVQARRVQIIIARNLIGRLTPRKPAVNVSALDMLACAAFSRHATHPYSRYTTTLRLPDFAGSKRPVMRPPSRNPIGTAIVLPFEQNQGHLEKLLLLPIAGSPGVNANESKREQSGIICG
jgi:hypothetical protein